MPPSIFQRVNPSDPWSAARGLVWTAALLMSVALLVWPSAALPLFWGLAVPALPAVFMLAPGLWRNVCPLASSNQLPRALGWSRQREIPAAIQGAIYPIGVALFFVFVSARKVVFNESGTATAMLVLGAMLAAFLGGLWFKGKSGWCSSICPLLPVQRIYGQAPLVQIANTHCKPCVGCAKNCLDQDPGRAQLSDQYDASRPYRNFRRFFAAVFPGYVIGFFVVPSAAEVGLLAMTMQLFVYCAVSLTVFHLLDACFETLRNSLPLAFAALAFNAYYWFSAPLMVQTLGGLGLALPPETVVVIRTALLLASLRWAIHADAAERRFLREQREQVKHGQIVAVPVLVETLQSHREHLRPGSAKTALNALQATNISAATAAVSLPVAASATAAGAAVRPLPAVAVDTSVGTTAGTTAAPARSREEVTPPDAEGLLRVDIKRGQTLLEAIEASDQEIDSGCRMGLCGADPVRIVDGESALCRIGETEANTLARLQCPSGTRLACMARAVRSQAVVARSGSGLGAPLHLPAAVGGDPAIRNVVVIGNGVAGITAAATVRRLHPNCRVLVLGRESHGAYNRMAIARLLNDAEAMPSLLLHKPAWYTQQRIDTRLDAEVTELDTQARTLTVADGERLSWDRLIIATGSPAWTPPIEHLDGPGAFVVRQADDMLSLRAFLRSQGARRVTVVGAGLLGIEVAQALRKFGVQVTVVSNTAAVLDRQADPMSSTLIVRHLKEKGIELLKLAQVREVVRATDRHIMALRTDRGIEIPTDALVCCTGTRPDVDLFRRVGIDTRNGIVVDANMRTSVEHVYAAGDVAEFEGQRPGLWASAIAQAEVAASNACGESTPYEPAPTVTLLKSVGIDFRSFGRVQRERDDDIELVDLQVGAVQYRKMLVSGGRVVGAILVNHPEQADRFAQMVKTGIDATPWLERAGRGEWVRLELRPAVREGSEAVRSLPLVAASAAATAASSTVSSSTASSASGAFLPSPASAVDPAPPIEVTRADDIERLKPLMQAKKNMHMV